MVQDDTIAAPMAAESFPLAVPRVLVVDDEEPVLASIQGILELENYHVVGTTSGRRAVTLAAQQFFDVVLTDLRLDDLDGLRILRELRRQSPDSVPIVLTGYASLDSAMKALREGAYDYLVKPCDVLELRTTIARGIERSRLSTQLRKRVRQLEQANETIRALNLELERRVDEATAELREEITERDEFTAAVSHDLKSPLTFIKGLASLRRRRATSTPASDPLIDALAQIEKSADRMAEQLDELVDTSRLQAGRPLEVRRQPTELISLARQVIAEHQQTASDRHVLQLTAGVPALVGEWDAIRLGRVLDNLLSNAVKYSPRGGAIQVFVDYDSPAKTSATLRVTDHGEGIPEVDLPHVFERFRRGGNVSGRIPGTGIGLSGARRILEQHGGTIAVESAVGEGTTVTVRLPLEPKSTVGSPQSTVIMSGACDVD
ncbi:MAG TPA: hybrid sensor histidine kinase/response regulator [Chloroflexota bacterium]|nr:hybrid sensor histidine kinase/response regulator [Chloroflexota bacterium]